MGDTYSIVYNLKVMLASNIFSIYSCTLVDCSFSRGMVSSVWVMHLVCPSKTSLYSTKDLECGCLKYGVLVVPGQD